MLGVVSGAFGEDGGAGSNVTAGVWQRTARGATVMVALMIAAGALSLPARAQAIGDELASRLTEAQQRQYVVYLRARAHHDRLSAEYWSAVEDLREQRRRKRSAGQPFTVGDFVAVQPPRYAGPPIPPDVAKIIASLRSPAKPDEDMAVVSDFLDSARKEFGFVPVRSSEAQFMRRYAEESLSLGLTKDQVVRVYALETGGRGTADMQAGIDPETKKGRPISSALGYAQLLGANSVNELAKHGDMFVSRLEALAVAPGISSANVASIRSRVRALRKMIRAVRSVPNNWSAHVAFARTPKGLGIHALNLDADIGPWLQTIKLKGVRDYAEKAGRPRLSGAEIELMNLAGPQTGLDMMDTPGRDMPTTNFFTEKAYNRNPIVKDKTGAELLQALESRMDQNVLKSGSVAFAKAFDAAIASRRAAARR